MDAVALQIALAIAVWALASKAHQEISKGNGRSVSTNPVFDGKSPATYG